MHFEAAPANSGDAGERGEGGEYENEVTSEEGAEAVMERIGRMPMPPYIKPREG